MLMALIEGKLSLDQENMEDILTSNIFGALKYCKPEYFVDILNSCLIKAFSKDVKSLSTVYHFSEVKSIEWEFWPTLQEGNCVAAEPDVLVEMIHTNGSLTTVLIEAKYLSGKSSLADKSLNYPNDQLAREWVNLKKRAQKRNSRPLLLYITKHMVYPSEEIECSQEDLKYNKHEEGQIAWISWRELSCVFKEKNDVALKDICKLLETMNLIYFNGISIVSPVSHNWKFRPGRSYNWDVNSMCGVTWSFK